MKYLDVVLSVLALVAFSSCGKSELNADGAHPLPVKTYETLKPGAMAYVRVKNYALYSGAPTAEESGGGKGYVLRSLSAGVVYHNAPPATNDGTFALGDAVKLIERKNGPPIFWAVEKNGKTFQLPEYLLAANMDEIDLLKKRDRIPDTMAIIYKDGDGTKTWGVLVGGIQGTAVLDSHGLHLMDYDKGSSPFALKGNAVVFDQSALKETWNNPAVFDGQGKAFNLKPDSIYYCLSEGKTPAFEAIDFPRK